VFVVTVKPVAAVRSFCTYPVDATELLGCTHIDKYEYLSQ